MDTENSRNLSLYFDEYLKNNFGYFDMKRISKSLINLDITKPTGLDDYLKGLEGCMIFMEEYGIIVKIENKKALIGTRIVDGDILQPLFSREYKNVVLEIFPGINLSGLKEEDSNTLWDKLIEKDIEFWDIGVRNIGSFPFNNNTAVIDRLSVVDTEENRIVEESRFFSANRLLKEHRKKRIEEYKKSEQYDFYQPLREKFEYHSKKNRSMDKIWENCRELRQEGKLISGWLDLSTIAKETNEDHLTKIVEISKEYKRTRSNTRSA